MNVESKIVETVKGSSKKVKYEVHESEESSDYESKSEISERIVRQAKGAAHNEVYDEDAI